VFRLKNFCYNQKPALTTGYFYSISDNDTKIASFK